MRAHMVKTISQSTVRPDVNLVWCICVFVFVNLIWCVYLYLISLQTCFANNQNRCEPCLYPQPTYSWKSASDAGTWRLVSTLLSVSMQIAIWTASFFIKLKKVMNMFNVYKFHFYSTEPLPAGPKEWYLHIGGAFTFLQVPVVFCYRSIWSR